MVTSSWQMRRGWGAPQWARRADLGCPNSENRAKVQALPEGARVRSKLRRRGMEQVGDKESGHQTWQPCSGGKPALSR